MSHPNTKKIDSACSAVLKLTEITDEKGTTTHQNSDLYSVGAGQSHQHSQDERLNRLALSVATAARPVGF